MPESDVAPYRAMAEFRHQIRRFLRFSDNAARSVGIEPKHHQALLAIKGLEPDVRPTVRALATRMQVRHHSMVELIDRLSAAGLVLRRRGTIDRREVLISITPQGLRLLRKVFVRNTDEIKSRAPALLRTLRAICRDQQNHFRGPLPAGRKATRR